MIDRTTPIPLYYQLSEDIRKKIESGIYSDGDKIPSENELCESFGVSRSVVRQALMSLSQAGLIVTERGRGAFIRERRVPISMTQKLDPLQDGMAKAGFKLSTEVLEKKLIVPEANIARIIGEEKAVFLKRLRYSDGRILLLVENYLPYSRASELLKFDGLDQASLYVFLQEHCGITVSSGRRKIEIAKAPPEVARCLGVSNSERVLFNQEETYDEDGRIVEYYESWHHPDRTQLNINLYRSIE